MKVYELKWRRFTGTSPVEWRKMKVYRLKWTKFTGTRAANDREIIVDEHEMNEVYWY